GRVNLVEVVGRLTAGPVEIVIERDGRVVDGAAAQGIGKRGDVARIGTGAEDRHGAARERRADDEAVVGIVAAVQTRVVGRAVGAVRDERGPGRDDVQVGTEREVAVHESAPGAKQEWAGLRIADVGADETVVDDEDAARLHPILNVGQTGAQGGRQAAVVAFVHHEDVEGGESEGADVAYVNGNKAELEEGRIGAGSGFGECGISYTSA